MGHGQTGDVDASTRIASSIVAMNARLDEIEAANRFTRRLLAGGSLALLAMAGIFGWSLWKTLERQLTPAKLEASLSRKIEAIGPPLGRKLVDEVVGAVPAYSNLAIERGQQVWPELSARIAGETESFAAATETMVRQRADKAVERVAGKLTADLKRDFPTLTDERSVQLAKRLQEGLIIEGAGLGEEVEATIGRERARLASMLEKLPLDEAAREPESRLQKRFMRGVLEEVDAAVEAWPVDDDPGAVSRSIGGGDDSVGVPLAVPRAAKALKVPATGTASEPVAEPPDPPAVLPAEETPPQDAPPASAEAAAPVEPADAAPAPTSAEPSNE